MRAPTLVGIITALHILAISAFIFIQGCSTTNPTLHSSQTIEQPPAPVLPPRPRTAVTAPRTPAPQTVVSTPITRPADASSYTIQKGDTLSQVAKKFGVSTRELVEVNNLTNPNSVRIGQEILIPPHARSGGSVAPAPAAPAPAASPAVPAAGGTYVILAGDSLSRIASRHGVKVADLKRANGLTGDRILVGDTLTIPGADAGTGTTAGSSAIPTPNETPSIADRIGVLDMTSESDTSGFPEIEVPDSSGTDEPPPVIPATTTMTPQNKPIPYKIQPDDTLDEIAKLFIVSKADIMELNGLGPDDVLTPNEVILIPPSEL